MKMYVDDYCCHENPLQGIFFAGVIAVFTTLTNLPEIFKVYMESKRPVSRKDSKTADA